MTMDINSLEAYRNKIKLLNERQRRVFDSLKMHGPCDPRTMLARLFPGSDDMNLVRPRFTELKGKGLIKKRERIRCPHSQERVWVWEIETEPSREKQSEFNLG